MSTVYKDKITIITGGGRDDRGNPLPVQESGPYRARVDPVRSDESVRAGQPPLTLYYHLTIPPGPGALLTPTGRVKWMGRDMSVQGDVEPWTVNGRVHHYECTLKVG